MGFQSLTLLAVGALLSVASCGLTSQAPSTGPPASAHVETRRWPTGHVRAFTAPTSEIRSMAARFARAVCEYDARHDSVTDFLTTAGPLATLSAELALRAASRGRLPWIALAERSERTNLRIDGISADSDDATVVVRGILTTRTSFATVRSFVSLTLSIRDGLVDAAEGTCL